MSIEHVGNATHQHADTPYSECPPAAVQGSDQELPLATMAELVVYRSETTPAVARLAPKQGNFLHGLLSRSGDMFSQTHAVTSMVGECGVNWCTTAHGVLLGPRSAAMAHGGSCISMAGPRESRTGPTSGRTARPTSPQLFQGYCIVSEEESHSKKMCAHDHAARTKHARHHLYRYSPHQST